ncbi:hypothetical protein [Streptomyces sp. F001]|uniref:hypothetical protein n=1 Tax=Streptomyces sp. F001 TaxID=1510026 RepID=UPI00320A5F91
MVEPTRKSVSVYRQYRDHAAEFGIPIAWSQQGHREDDSTSSGAHRDDLVAHCEQSAWVRAQEQPRHAS